MSESKTIVEKALKETWHPKYTIWCMNCNFERTVRDRPLKCPKCKTTLAEKRYLM